VYFHSLRSTNTGYQQDRPTDDFLDIYVADIVAGLPGPGRNLGASVNSAGSELQPAFTADGATMYFASDRDPSTGMAIYRSSRTGAAWSAPELVMQGLAGEPSLTADGNCLYFVHVLSDAEGIFDSDVWQSERLP
jgi:Tol biopolymer transport system component